MKSATLMEEQVLEFMVPERKQRVMVVFGTRPEGIKMMPVVRELRNRASLDTLVVVTGQHRQMLDQVFEVFKERPDVDLNLMTPGQTLAAITARVIEEMSKVYASHCPDVVLVHGDTTTAMAAAVAAFYAQVAVGHVEAGLRSFDLKRPWPEEFNRVTIDGLADLMFAPTAAAAENLAREYNRRGKVIVTGNTGIDAILQMTAIVASDPRLSAKLRDRYGFLDAGKRLILVTGHRRESFGGGFERICEALALIAQRGDVEILYPVHLNPNVQGVVKERLGAQPGVHLIEPADYADMAYLMRRASLLLTDSGGIQEEGPALGRPVLVMRDVTERPEAIETGAARLVGTDPAVIIREITLLLDDAGEYARRSRPVFPYGDGTAALKIADAIELFDRKN